MTEAGVQMEDAPCRNPQCPYGGVGKKLTLGGTVIAHGMCDECRADAEVKRDRESLDVLVAEARRGIVNVVGSRMVEWRLATYPRDAHGEVALAVADTWLGEFYRGERKNLLLYGPAGRGKTGLAVGIGWELAEAGVPVAYAQWLDILDELRGSYDGGKKPDLAYLHRAQVMILDDLGAERPTEWAREQLMTLVHRRYVERLPMIVTSNYGPGDLGRRLGHDDPVIGERLVSRLWDNATRFKVEGNDRRA